MVVVKLVSPEKQEWLRKSASWSCFFCSDEAQAGIRGTPAARQLPPHFSPNSAAAPLKQKEGTEESQIEGSLPLYQSGSASLDSGVCNGCDICWGRSPRGA